MLSYSLRLNRAVIPFTLPVLAVAAIWLLASGNRADGALVAAILPLQLVGYCIVRFWIRNIEENEAREWQRLNRENGDETG